MPTCLAALMNTIGTAARGGISRHIESLLQFIPLNVANYTLLKRR
jgi:hypothetical protein